MEILKKLEGDAIRRLERDGVIAFADRDVTGIEVVRYEDTGKVYLEVDMSPDGAYGPVFFQLELRGRMLDDVLALLTDEESL